MPAWITSWPESASLFTITRDALNGWSVSVTDLLLLEDAEESVTVTNIGSTVKTSFGVVVSTTTYAPQGSSGDRKLPEWFVKISDNRYSFLTPVATQPSEMPFGPYHSHGDPLFRLLFWYA